MRKNIVLLSVFMLFHFIATTQKSLKPSFTSINQAGVGWGATGEGLQLQTINGLSYKTYSAGLGIGLDYYWERTVPLFVDLRKNIFSKKQTPFVYADMGINVPWVKSNKENIGVKSDYKHGSYYDIGIGYRIPVNKKLFTNLSFGFSQKKFQEKIINEIIIFDFPYGGNNSENYTCTLRRFSLKAGLSF